MPPTPPNPNQLSFGLGAAVAPAALALSEVGKALGKVMDAARAAIPFVDTFVTKLQQLGDWFARAGLQMVDAFQSVVGDKLIGVVKEIGRAVGGLAVAAPVAAGALALVGQAIVGMVAKANPAVAQQFSFALNDTLAVLGQMLVPVLQVVTQVVRLFGDAMASFSGTMGSALGEIVSALIPIFEVFADVFARVMQVVAQVLKFVAPIIRIAAEGIKTIFDWIGKAIRFILDLIGIDIADSAIKKGASVGAAAKQAQISTVQDALNRAMVSAFSLGTASGVNYAQETAKNTGEMVMRIGGLADRLNGILTALQNPLKVYWELREVERKSKEIEGTLAPGGLLHDRLAAARAERLFMEAAFGTAMGASSPFAKRNPFVAGAMIDGSGTVKADAP